MGDKKAPPGSGPTDVPNRANAFPQSASPLGSQSGGSAKRAQAEIGNPDRTMSLWGHLRELKQRVKMIAIAYIASLVFWLLIPVGAFDPSALFTGMYYPMIAVILNNAKDLAAGRITIIMGSMTAPLEIYFLASAIISLITASPVIGYEIYKFVDPALRPGERQKLTKFMTAFTGLLVTGALIGYFILVPAIIRFMAFFAQIIGASTLVTAGDYYGMVFIAVGATAIAFTTPSVFLLLVDYGIVSTNALAKNRLIVYLTLYVIVAALTPEPVVGHFGMFFPIVGMLEVSILIGRRMERNRAIKNGTLIEQEPRCRYCKAKLDPRKAFCPKCGRAKT